MKFIQQINDLSCAHACIAMVTDEDIFSLWERFPQPLSDDAETSLLIENKIFPVISTPAPAGPRFRECGLYFMSVPSLSKPKTMHRVVVEIKNDGHVVYDPQRGRFERQFYSWDSLNPDSPEAINCYSDVVRLDFEILSNSNILKHPKFLDCSNLNMEGSGGNNLYGFNAGVNAVRQKLLEQGFSVKL